MPGGEDSSSRLRRYAGAAKVFGRRFSKKDRPQILMMAASVSAGEFFVNRIHTVISITVRGGFAKYVLAVDAEGIKSFC